MTSLAPQSWDEEKRRFDQRVARKAVLAPTILASRDSRVALAISSFDKFEGEYETSPYLMLAHSLSARGRFRRTGDWGRVEGILRPGTTILALPHHAASGHAPNGEMLGLVIDPTLVQAYLEDACDPGGLEPAAIRLHADPLIGAVMIAMWRDAEVHGLSSAFFDHGLQLILQRLSKPEVQYTSQQTDQPLSGAKMKCLTDLIDSKLDLNISVDELAAALNMNKRRFTKALQASTGLAPFQFLTSRRMEHAKGLLKTNRNITEISLEVGYANPAKFASAFRRISGYTPSEWRRQIL